MFPFSLDLDKTHRAAAALSEARREAQDIGVERREGVRKRIKEVVKETGGGKQGESTTQEKQ